MVQAAPGTICLFGPQMREDPYPIYRRYRETAPILWDDFLKGWVVTSHADITAGLKDKRFSVARILEMRRRRNPNPTLTPIFDTLAKNLLWSDDPDHTRLRALVHYAFKRAEVDRYEDLIRARVDALIDAGLARAARGESWDFVRGFAVPLPIGVISSIVGIPEEDRDMVKAWCDAYSLISTNPAIGHSEERLRRGAEAIEAFKSYVAARAEHYRRQPADTLLSHLVQAEQEGDSLTQDELLACTLLLLTAGNETTTGLLSNGLLAMLKHPEVMARLRAEPTLIPSAVEEFLRYDPPVQVSARIATEALELGGQAIAAGDLVIFILAAAGRDPEAFDTPDGLDVARKPNHHLAFGQGAHLCIGLHLARLEARLAFERLLERLPIIELAQADVRHGVSFNLRCPEHLWLDVAARADDREAARSAA